MATGIRGLILAGAVAAGWCANGATRAESLAPVTATGDEQVWSDSLRLNEIVQQAIELNLTAQQHRDLVEYLKSQ